MPPIALSPATLSGPAIRLSRCLILLVLASLAALSPARAQDAPPSQDCCLYVVAGLVWYDQNSNGIKEGSEPVLPGWTVQALDVGNNVVGTTTTNALGQYSFTLPVSCGNTFKLKQVVQSGWTQTFPVANGIHTGLGTGCSTTPLGPYDFGNTQPDCQPFSKTYTLDGDFNMGTYNGAVTNSNQLELSPTPTTWPFAWIANSDGTLSKVSTVTGNEVARYYTGPPDNSNNYVYLAPSRTVVDKDGNCWVANRNWGGTPARPASVTQFANAGGIDWNNNSVINTSSDANNNGVIDPSEILPWGQDERAIRHYELGPLNEQARGMALDKTGGLWVGMCVSQTLVKVSPNLPTATYSANNPPTAAPALITINLNAYPYGLALAPNGKFYMSESGMNAYEIDPGLASGGTNAGPAVTEMITHTGSFNYGLAVDKNCIVWLAMSFLQSGNYGCVRWDPSLTLGNPANGWTYSAPNAAGPGRGICVDFNNNIWMACNDANNSVTKFTNTPIPTVIGSYPTTSAVPIGVGAASDGHIIVTPGGTQNWTKLNSATGAPMPLAGPQLAGPSPYTYSDFTGAQQSLSGLTQGTWTVTTDAGTSAHVWNFIGWNQSTPPGTSVQIEARTAQNLIALLSQTWTTIGSPGFLGSPMVGRYIETRVRLQRVVEGCNAPYVTPVLYDLTVAAICDPCAFANCPSDTTIPCDNPMGAEFFYNPPVLKSICDSTWTVNCSPPGPFFPIGTTAITCVAINAKDDTVLCQFNLTVLGGCDNTPKGACCIQTGCTVLTELECEQAGGIYLGDNTNCLGDVCHQDCVEPPNNLAAWWPFNSATGSVTPNLAGPLTGGTLVNAPTPLTGQQVGNAYSFNGTNQYISVPNHPTLNLGAGDFTLDAWVRTSQASGVTTILDKRDAGSIQGIAFFLFDGYPSLQMAVGNVWSNFILTNVNGGAPAFVADGNWHLVAVTVDRDDPTGVQFYVDGIPVGTTFNPVPRSGNLNSSSAVLIGQRNPLLGGGFFAGSLDEVEIIRRELSNTEVADLFAANVAGKCPETCYATQNATCCGGLSSNSAITICNYSLAPHTYSWGLTQQNGGFGCGPIGATAFSPAFGSVTVPAQGCVTVPVYIGCPSNIPLGQTACYSVQIYNHDTGRIFGCQGSVRRAAKWCWKDVPFDPVPVGTIHEVLAGTSELLQFDVARVGQPSPGMPPMTLNYMIAAVRGDNGEPSQGVRLNGLPPGEPVLGTLSLEAGDHTTVLLEASYDEEALIGYDRLVAWGDEDGDGIDEPLGEVAVRSTTIAGTSAVPGEPGKLPGPAEFGRLLLAFPNPFGKSDQIRFRIDGDTIAKVKLRLFDLQGRVVKVFYLENMMEPGEHSVTWNTLDGQGRPLHSGIYFLRLDVDNRSESVKLMIRP